jgi:hypothetical protein
MLRGSMFNERVISTARILSEKRSEAYANGVPYNEFDLSRTELLKIWNRRIPLPGETFEEWASKRMHDGSWSESQKWYHFLADHNPGGDILYELNKFNPLAIVVNSISAYLTGEDTYGVTMSATEAAFNIATVVPVFKIGQVGQVTFKIGKKAFTYLDDLASKTDLYHNFPLSFDKHIIKNGAWSKRIKDGADWYELRGSINGAEGMYQIGVNSDGLIFHRAFVEF